MKKKISKKAKLLFILIPVIVIVLCAGLFIYLNTLTETERHVVECAQEIKDRLKNPESLEIYEIQYYPTNQDIFSDDNASYLMIYLEAENSYGGTTSGYVSFKNWSIQGFYNLNNTYNSNDAEISSLMSQMTSLVISAYWDNSDNVSINANKIMRHVE